MKSNHERSNECLPPKKRELPSSTLPSDNCSASTPPATDSQRAENMAWLASVAGGKESGTSGRHSSGKSERPQYKTSTSDPLTSSSSSSSLKLHPSSSQSPVGGTVHYTKLPHSLQFLTSPYHPPYAGYIPPQLLPPPLSSSPSTSASNRHSETSKHDQHRASLERTSMPPPPTDSTPHRVQISTSPRTVPSHHHHSHHSVQPHHGLGHGMSQVLLQYTDGSRKEEIRSRELHNGGLDMGRRFGSSESNHPKHGSKFRDSFHSSPHEVRQRVLPSDYGADDTMGLRTSVVLMPNSHGDLQLVPEKLKTSAPTHLQKGGILVGKPVHRNTSSNTTNSFTFSPPSLPQTVIQTTHHSTEPMTIGLPSTSIYPQPPLIGYITGAGGNQQAPMGYQQHLLIPGTQQVIIPVSGGGMTTLDPVTSHLTSYTQAAPFPTYVAAQKAESHDHARGLYQHAASEAVVHLPVVPAPSDQPASSAPAAGSAQSLPPYFFKGSIIQLANGELKQVEDLKTEDFIQSAEISSELKIDSSTVERIEGSHTSPDFAVVQFSVGEHRAQVSVEVLVEYPFFVFGQGWSSCCPDRTNQLLELPCTKLSVGDVCISLTLKNMKNGSLTKYQSLDHLTEPSSGHLKASRSASDAPQRCSGGGSREQENGVRGRGGGGGGNADVRNGDLTFGDKLLKDPVAGSGKTTGGRKRRWSAPEGRSVDKSEYEPPLTLPRPSFIPHEVKLSIEGRSNIGK